jgi:hypothetical protein
MCDTFTEGKWTFVVDGPHRGCRIMEVFEVKRATRELERAYDFSARDQGAQPLAESSEEMLPSQADAAE